MLLLLVTVSYMQLCAPLGNDFLTRYAAGMTQAEYHMSTFLLELTLQCFQLTDIPASALAAGAINLAGAFCAKALWVSPYFCVHVCFYVYT